MEEFFYRHIMTAGISPPDFIERQAMHYARLLVHQKHDERTAGRLAGEYAERRTIALK